MILVGLMAVMLGAEGAPALEVVSLANLPEDSGTYTPWATTPTSRETDPFTAEAVEDFRRRLATWAPAQASDARAVVDASLGLLALLDAARHPAEFDAPAIMLAHLQARFPRETLIAALTNAAMHPHELTPRTQETAFACSYPEVQDLRERMAIYARKMLGRILGRLPPS